MDDRTLERRLEAKDKLIAELLEALEAMLRIHIADMYDAGFNPPTCHCGLCNNARAVIRKAKGE